MRVLLDTHILIQWCSDPDALRIAPITPAVAGELEMPADRLIVATARVFGAVVVTNDEEIRESGLVSAL